MSDSDRVDACVALLLEACERSGIQLSGDMRVSEKDAAVLLGYSHGYLKELRGYGTGPAHFSLGMNGCRVSYRLVDIAAWIEMKRTSGD